MALPAEKKSSHICGVLRLRGMTKHITKLFAVLLLTSIATGCVVHTPASRTTRVVVRHR